MPAIAGSKQANSQESSPHKIIVLESDPGSHTMVPEGTDLASSAFSREGSDLLIRTPDGTDILINGYFASPTPPSLTTSDGSVFPPDLVAQLAGPVAPGQYAQAESVEYTPPIGQVSTLVGEVTVTRANGTSVKLAVDSPVFEGDVVETGENANISLVLNDGSVFALDSQSRLVLEKLDYDKDTGEGESFFSMLKGVLAFTSGDIAANNPEQMVIQTPVYMLGVRGTTGAIEVGAETDTVSLLPDAGGTVGSIVVNSGTGSIVLDQPNQSLQFTGTNVEPVEVQLSSTELGSLFGAALSSLSSGSERSRNGSNDDSQISEGESGQTDSEANASTDDQGDTSSSDGEGSDSADGESGAQSDTANTNSSELSQSENVAESADETQSTETEVDTPTVSVPSPTISVTAGTAASGLDATVAPVSATAIDALGAVDSVDGSAEQADASSSNQSEDDSGDRSDEEVAVEAATENDGIDSSAESDGNAGGNGNDEEGESGNDDEGESGDDDEEENSNGNGGSANIAAVIDLNGADGNGIDFAATFTVAQGPISIVDGDLTVTDDDGTEIVSATVTITNLLDGAAETLDADASGTAITSTYDSATGVLSLSGTDSVANYQQVLRTVTYANDSATPDETDRAITFRVNDGTDDSDAATSVVSVVGGMGGDDLINGTNGADLLTGLAGNDTIDGGSGDDTLLGGDGDDSLDGGVDNDSLDGGEGNDTILGGDESDTLLGGEGNDSLNGQEKEDSLDGGAGLDTLFGGDGEDTLLGGEGDDQLDGGEKEDFIEGGSGNDNVIGDKGDDTLVGGSGSDTLTGGEDLDQFSYQSVGDGVSAATNDTAANLGIAGDTITDFDDSKDVIAFLQNAFNGSGTLQLGNLTDDNFTAINTAYDGQNLNAGTTISGSRQEWDAGRDSFIFDSTDTLYYDADGAGDGYTVIATVQGDAVDAADVQIVAAV